MSVIEDLIGVTMADVQNLANEEIVFTAQDGRKWKLYHWQDCCETVKVEDVCGDLTDLIGAPIVEAEEVSSDDAPAREYVESYTWTFYKLRTIKGGVTIRWLGESNGFYSESVQFCEVI